MKLVKAALIAAVVAASQLYAGVVSAAPPPTVVGTWSLVHNQTFAQLIITNQGALGTCKVLLGNISGAPLSGWYCPSNGRIHFIHKNSVSGLPIKVYNGVVAERVVGSPDRIGGTYTSDYAPTEPFGDYPFSATK